MRGNEPIGTEMLISICLRSYQYVCAFIDSMEHQLTGPFIVRTVTVKYIYTDVTNIQFLKRCSSELSFEPEPLSKFTQHSRVKNEMIYFRNGRRV